MGVAYISVLEHCRKMKFRTFLHLKLMSKNFMMSRFSDFAVCSTNLYIWSSGVYIQGLEHHLKLKYVNSFDRITQSFNIATLE